MAGVAAVSPKFYFPGAEGGSVDVYIAGTTTRTTTWQDRALSTANENPVELNARAECILWLDSALSYKFVVKDADGATIYTVDNVAGAETSATEIAKVTVDRFSGTGAQTAFTLPVDPGNENLIDVYVSGVYQQKNTFSVTGTTLTFDVAPASGTNNIEVVINELIDSATLATTFGTLADEAAASAAAAATSEDNAAASETAAAASAAAAATSETNAATSESNAATSAAAAASSEAGAAAIVLGDFLQSGTGAVPRTFTAKAREVVTPYDFGAVDNKTVDSSSALQLFFNYINSNSAVKAVCHGNFGIGTALTFDGQDLYQTVSRVTDWDCVLWDISASGLDQLVTFRNCRSHSFTGQLIGYGKGSSTYSTRATRDIFVFDTLMSYTRFEKIVPNYALRWGFVIEDDCSQMKIEHIRAAYCGTSNVATSSMSRVMSNIVNTGSASNLNQRSTVTLDSALPSHVTASEALLVVEDLSTTPTTFHAHEIVTINSTTEIAVWPWIDPARIGASAYIAYGGALKIDGNDSSVAQIGYLDAFTCGIGIWNKALYPPSIGTMCAQSCNVAVALGNNRSAAMESGSIAMLYAEANNLSVVQLTVAAITYQVGMVNGDTSAEKFYVCNNVDTSYTNGVFTAGYRVGKSKSYENLINPVAQSYQSSTSVTLKPTANASMPVVVKHRDTATVNLVSDIALAKITGRTGYVVMAAGSGANGQPTGTWTFTPESTWSVNGGVAGASATISGFVSPTPIVVHADYSTLNWRVFKAGQNSLTGSAIYDPASLATGAEVTTNITVTGAAIGDYVTGVSFSRDTQGIKLSGTVSATDTVRVTLRNDTGGAIDLLSGTIYVLVTKR